MEMDQPGPKMNLVRPLGGCINCLGDTNIEAKYPHPRTAHILKEHFIVLLL